jgi:hypothetical protein
LLCNLEQKRKIHHGKAPSSYCPWSILICS